MSERNPGPKGGNKNKKYFKPKQNERGCKSLSNLSSSNTRAREASSTPNQKVKATHQHQTIQKNAYRNDPPPSYNESVSQYNQMGYPNFNGPLPYTNSQQLQSGFPLNVYSPNPYNQIPLYPLQPQQQFRPRKQYQQPFLHQPNQQSSKNTQFPKPRPRTSLLQSKATTSGNQSASFQQTITHIDLNCLVREISNFKGCFASVETISKILERSYNDVLAAVNGNGRIFSTITDTSNKVLVELCPKIEFCYKHIGSFGCTKQKCLSLHICADFINDECKLKNCPFGHIWKTDHNNLVFKKFSLSILPNANLHNLIKKVLGKIIIPELCTDYLENECKLDDKCNKLHICCSYVSNLGNCSDGTNCILSHNIRDAKCLMIFQNFGISSKESPRDLLKILRDRCLEGGQAVLNKQEFNNCQGRPSTTDQYKTTDRSQNKYKTMQPQVNDTVCCWHFNGNVTKATICLENINKNCRFYSNGCKYLHCNHKSHWQFGSNDNWYNFHLFHSQFLDKKYSDVNCDKTVLPKLNPTKVNNQQGSLFRFMGNQNSKIDFINMKMDCEEVKKLYDIRHLATESYGVCSGKESTEFNWYFLENDGKWVLFGGTNSSSLLIEKAYQEQPAGKYNFKSSQITYLLDFSKMTQKNLSTQKIRPIKRRPVIKQYNIEDEKHKFKLPKHWDKMSDHEEYKKVILSSGGEEYVEIRKILRLSLPMINIVNIYRIQNAYLWKQFQNKQTELKKMKDDDLNIQKLFHGIDPNFLDDICRNNLEFRLHDDPTDKKPYGDGTYFYNSAGVAAKNCKIDFMGNKTVLVAEVIIGSVALGSEGMTRPPTNPSTNDALCDTTTDSVEGPTLYVKFNRQEYYPAYIVELK